MQCSPSSRIYQPLQDPGPSIRLLELRPALGDHNALECCLEHAVPLLPQPSYEALSYCWNAPSAISDAWIRVNGIRFPVSGTLTSALRHLRLTDRPRWLWIDAVCINQHDLDERMSQVKLMRQIYSQANKVVIWLGDQSEGSSSAFQQVDRLVEAAERKARSNDSRDIHQAQGNKSFPRITGKVWTPLFDLMSRPYFRLVWIIQEVALGQDVVAYCGPDTRPWAHFEVAVEYLYDVRFNILSFFSIFGCSWSISIQRRGNLAGDATILNLLSRYHHFQATDSRDQIDGLLGLLPHSDLAPDYSSGWQSLYREFALSCMNDNGKLDVLSGVYGSHPQLPSWTPDWQQAIPTIPLVQGLFEYSNQRSPHPRPEFSASLDTTCAPRAAALPGAIILRGLILDEVEALGIAYMPGNDSIFSLWSGIRSAARRIVCLHSQEQVCQLHSKEVYRATGERLCEAFWQTLCAGVPERAHEFSQHAYHAFQMSMRVFRPLQKFILARFELFYFVVMVLKHANLFKKSPMGHGMDFV